MYHVYIILFFYSIPIIAQIDTAIWYPLDEGNYWEYYNTTGELEHYGETVMGDTVMPNGKTYAAIKVFDFITNEIRYRYLRDENNERIFIYNSVSDTEIIGYDFINSSWLVIEPNIYKIREYEAYNYNSLVNDTLLTYGFADLIIDTTNYFDTTWLGTAWTVSKGLGLVQFWAEGSGHLRLIGCIINGQQYGLVDIKNSNLATEEYKLSIKNYPNPFNPTTQIVFQIKESGHVRLAIFNTLGQKVATLVNEVKSKGKYSVNFNAENLPSGVYICSLQVNDLFINHKMAFVK
ncbi:MAG: T9SS type A sorting domain-containing protein [Melioribacteraceae bacterium]|nr:T9SS type A sorting domain-containing protein [Melioribacteraceae bacterium]MCF8356737.1 T9SS type A sorting domain-containing protein [Melioribacteraceae bacterium]MCF8395960.1 T9SS type A sorting domain-containing protein [Melioribacteraceae bacterium]MCF8419523.1 T9SS type A sorting domain-containing protein [Melioribacteraceae bacterium]